MNIIRCSEIRGKYISEIEGQDRYGYSKSDFSDFFDVEDMLKEGMDYEGNELMIYDLKSGEVFKPFLQFMNVSYGQPIFSDGYLYFLRIDFNNEIVQLYKYLPNECLENIFEIDIDKVDLYNLMLFGKDVNVISQGEKFVSYYPKKFSFNGRSREALVCIEDDKLYFNAWYEDGVVDGEITEDYKYYEKLVIRDTKGKLISSELGCLNILKDGSFMLS